MSTDYEICREVIPTMSVKPYPRYKKDVFEECKALLEIPAFQADYAKWESGDMNINLNWKTNRRIRVGGSIYDSIVNKFKTVKSIASNVINDAETYEAHISRIKTDIDRWNDRVWSHNRDVHEMTKQVNLLESWDHFVEFQGKRFGLSKPFMNGVHRKNNCLGKIIESEKKEEYESEHECGSCRSGFGAGRTCHCYWSTQIRTIYTLFCERCGEIETARSLNPTIRAAKEKEKEEATENLNTETFLTEVVKFGKYKGQCLSILLQDTSYCKWITETCSPSELIPIRLLDFIERHVRDLSCKK